jgi:DNA-directed RNA polymerase subunit RPC12/RpoP
MNDEILKVKEFKAKFEIRKKTGKGDYVVIGLRSDDWNEVTKEFDRITKKWEMGIEPISVEIEVKPKEFVYVCPDCKTEIPVGDMEVEKIKLFCSNCKTWKEFERREK